MHLAAAAAAADGKMYRQVLNAGQCFIGVYIGWDTSAVDSQEIATQQDVHRCVLCHFGEFFDTYIWGTNNLRILNGHHSEFIAF